MIFAYLDPGAGSLVIQAILAAMLAVPFFLRSQLSALVNRIRGRGADSTDQPTS
jgi:hypothetical protein